MDVKESKRKLRRILAHVDFLNTLHDNGGLLSVNDVAKALGISTIDVYTEIENNNLIGFPSLNHMVVPGFQIDGDKTIYGLSEILHWIREQHSVEAKCSVFLQTIELYYKEDYLYKFLQEENSEYLDFTTIENMLIFNPSR